MVQDSKLDFEVAVVDLSQSSMASIMLCAPSVLNMHPNDDLLLFP